jgi:hypothetical protein
LLLTCAFLGLSAEVASTAQAGTIAGLPATPKLRHSLRESLRATESATVISLNEEGATAVAERVNRQPVVLCDPSEETEVAYAFALLTGRCVVEAGDLGEETFAALADARSVFLMPGHRLTTRSLFAMLAARRTQAPDLALGFFYPFGSLERELFTLKAALCARYGLPSGLGHTFMYPLESRDERFTAAGIDFVLGPGGGAAAVERDLRRPTAFLFATPHSNGVNLSLGELVLCAREDRDVHAKTPQTAPPCYHADICSRRSPNTVLLGASLVRSAVVFLYTCWGVLLRDGSFAVSTSLAARIAASPFTAAFLTTCASSLLDRAAGPCLARRLAIGHTLGAATSEFNHCHRERYGNDEDVVLLLGDPETTLPACNADLGSDLIGHRSFARFASETGLRLYDGSSDGTGVSGSARPAPVPSETFAALEHSRCVVHATQRLGRAELSYSLAQLSRAVDGLWLSSLALNGRLEQLAIAQLPAGQLRDYERSTRALHDAWLEFYTAMVATLGGYVRLQVDRYYRVLGVVRSSRPCPYCGGVVSITSCELLTGATTTRRLIDCASCGTIVDGLAPVQCGTIRAPGKWCAGGAVSVEIEAHSSHGWHGPLLAAALLEPFIKAPSATPTTTSVRSSDIAASRLRIALPVLAVPANLTPGVHHLNCVLMHNANVTLLRRAVTVIPPLASPHINPERRHTNDHRPTGQ